MAKRYYWLKLPDNFFKQKVIKKLRKVAGGDTYTLIYLELLLIAMKNDSKLYFEGIEDDFAEEIALEIDEDVENVKMTLIFLQKHGLIEVVEEDEYLLTQCNDMVGSETSSAARVRKHRQTKMLQCNNDVTSSNASETTMLQSGNVEIEKELDIDKDKELKKEKELDIKIDSCAERNSTPETFIQLPLNTGKLWSVTTEYIEELKPLYPAVDVEQELRKMRGWLDSNVKNRKTNNGIKRFITGWLAREQDRGRIINPGAGPYSYQQTQRQTVNQFKDDMMRLADEQGGGW